ncbi:MAG: polysaccharide biosynthesis C-terminal domain-containing protein [Thermomicrobiales bacterium]|nr:polysaccharide biosynthesis C-terminal domain-containing protein [Thermomicrobiales bacterium]
MSFVRDALSLLATSTIVTPIGLITSILLARLLGAEALGFYSVLNNFTSLAVLLFLFGWPTAVVYRIRNRRRDPALVASTGLVVIAGVSTVVVGVGLLCGDFLREAVLGGAPPDAYAIALLIIAAQLFARLFVALARALGRFDLSNRYVLLVAVGLFVAFSGALGLAGASLRNAMFAALGVHVVASLGIGAFVLRESGLSRQLSTKELSQTIGYSGRSYVQSIAGQLHEQVDVLMLAAFLIDPAEIAAYAIAVGVVNRLKIVPEAVSGALFPHVAELDAAEAGSFAARAARHSAAWAWLAALTLGFASPWLIPLLFGPDFKASVLPALVLLPGSALLTTYMVLARFFMGIDRQGVIVRCQVSSLVVNAVLNVVLIPIWGILGAATASLISYGLETLLMVLAFRSATGQTILGTMLLRPSDIQDYARFF